MPGKISILAAAALAAPLLTGPVAAQLSPPDPIEIDEDAIDTAIPNLVLPDLIVETFNAPGCAVQGEQIGPRLQAEVRNVGGADVTDNFPVGFYLSPEPVIAGFNTLLDGGREFVDEIASQQSKPVDIAPVMSIPASYPTGTAHIGVMVDEFDAIAESDEDNNTATRPIEIRTAAQGCP